MVPQHSPNHTAATAWPQVLLHHIRSQCRSLRTAQINMLETMQGLPLMLQGWGSRHVGAARRHPANARPRAGYALSVAPRPPRNGGKALQVYRR